MWHYFLFFIIFIEFPWNIFYQNGYFPVSTQMYITFINIIDGALFPCQLIVNTVITILEPVYDVLLNNHSHQRFSLSAFVQGKKCTIISTLLSLLSLCFFYAILIILSNNCSQFFFNYHTPIYILIVMVLIIAASCPHSFFMSSFLVLNLIFGNAVIHDTRPPNSTDSNICWALLYLIQGILMWYPCIKNVDIHHPGFFMGNLFKLLPFNTFSKQVDVVDTSHNLHRFTFAPYATVSDLHVQISLKLKISKSYYWLSCAGKPLREHISLNSVLGLVLMNGRIFGGNNCCIKNCNREAGSRKFESMIGVYELACSPFLLQQIRYY